MKIKYLKAEFHFWTSDLKQFVVTVTGEHGFEIIPAVTFIQDNTPRLYTEDEVLEREQLAFMAGGKMKPNSEEYFYKSFDDYKQTLNLK